MRPTFLFDGRVSFDGRVGAMTQLERDIDAFLGRMGFELVVLERGGGHRKPLLRLRIDRRHGPSARGVSVEDCARVTRELREWVETRDDVPEDYVLEVSSPGVERPLVRPRDYERFAGREVRVKGYAPLAGSSKELEGELVGLVGDGEDRVQLRVAGEAVTVPLAAIAKANLVYRWEEDL